MRNLIRYQVYYLCCVVLSSVLLEVISTAKRTANIFPKELFLPTFENEPQLHFSFFFYHSKKKIIKSDGYLFLVRFFPRKLELFRVMKGKKKVSLFTKMRLLVILF